MKRGLVYLSILVLLLMAMAAFNGGGQYVQAAGCNCYLPYLSTSSVLPTTCVFTNASSDNITVSFKMLAANLNSGESMSTSEISLGGVNAGGISQFQFKTGGVARGSGGSAPFISAANSSFSPVKPTDGRYAGIVMISGDDVIGAHNNLVFSCPNVSLACFQSSPSTAFKPVKRNLTPMCLDIF